MVERAVKIAGGAGDPRGEQMGCGIAGWVGETGLDMAARGTDLALRKQHGGQEMAEHGIAGGAAQSLFADLARLIALAGIEGGSGAANGFFGGVLAHAGTLEQPGR